MVVKSLQLPVARFCRLVRSDYKPSDYEQEGNEEMASALIDDWSLTSLQALVVCDTGNQTNQPARDSIARPVVLGDDVNTIPTITHAQCAFA